jgi:hypothetical protein
MGEYLGVSKPIEITDQAEDHNTKNGSNQTPARAGLPRDNGWKPAEHLDTSQTELRVGAKPPSLDLELLKRTTKARSRSCSRLCF